MLESSYLLLHSGSLRLVLVLQWIYSSILKKTDSLTILNPPVHEHGLYLYLFRFYFIFSIFLFTTSLISALILFITFFPHAIGLNCTPSSRFLRWNIVLIYIFHLSNTFISCYTFSFKECFHFLPLFKIILSLFSSNYFLHFSWDFYFDLYVI